MKAEEIFKILSDKTRLRLYRILIEKDLETAVCELADAIQCTHYNTSRHLKILQLAGLIKEQKNGRWVFYSVVKTKDKFILDLNKAIKSLNEKNFKEDLERFKLRIGFRKNGKIQFCINKKLFNKKEAGK